MNVTYDHYASEHGWVINLPPDWERMPQGSGMVIAVHRPVVFCSKTDEDISFTWMIGAHPIKRELAQRFMYVVGSARPAEQEMIRAAASIFPLIGSADSCRVVTLPDGARGIEMVETYYEESDEPEGRKRGIQVILPLDEGTELPEFFQRLCFYATHEQFTANLNTIRSIMDSFHYKQPYGTALR